MAEFRTPVKTSKISDATDVITIPPSPFLRKLGYGTGVSVMQLVRSPKAGQIRSPWALKMLNKRTKPNKIYTDRIVAEADLLKRMSHPNIVGFRAFGVNEVLYLGMEVCDLSLGDMIEQKVEEDNLNPFSPKQILKVAVDIGNALDYLHVKMQILHGDIKSYNILINGDFVICKLCDFGVTLPLDENRVFDGEKNRLTYFGTELWSAPEVIHGGTISDKTDIWPLGLTLWEMMSLMPPHTQTDDDTLDQSLSFDESMVDYSERYGTRPAVPANIGEQYGNPLALFHCATEHQPEHRPSAAQLASAATDMLQDS